MAELHGGRLLGQVSPLNISKRKGTDAVFAFAFIACCLAAIVFGSLGIQNNHYNDLIAGPPATMECASADSHIQRGLLAVVHRRGLADPKPLDPSQDVKIIAGHAGYLLPSSLTLMLVGVLMIQMLKHCARPFVYASMIMVPMSLFSAAGTIYASGDGDVSAACIPMAFAIIFCLLLWCSRRGLRLCAALLEQAAHVLTLHPGLILVALALMLLSVAVVALALAASVVLFSNGAWVPIHQSSSRGATCLWIVDSTAAYGVGFVGLALVWTGLLAFTMRFFIVSLVTAMWYFDTAGGAIDANADPAAYQLSARRAPVRTATRLAFTKSIGTLCYSSLVLTICQILKAMARQTQRRSDSLFVCLAACCIRCLLDVIEFLNKFVVAMHAISGADFCSAGKEITSLFSRHGLNAWFCDQISAYVLATASFSFAALGGGFTYLGVVSTLEQPASIDDKRVVASAFGAGAFLLGWFILSFCGSLILNIVDASYTCLAVDMDNGAQHQPPMRDAMIPIVKPDYVVVVQHPGGPGQPQAAIGMPVATPATTPHDAQGTTTSAPPVV